MSQNKFIESSELKCYVVEYVYTYPQNSHTIIEDRPIDPELFLTLPH